MIYDKCNCLFRIVIKGMLANLTFKKMILIVIMIIMTVMGRIKLAIKKKKKKKIF